MIFLFGVTLVGYFILVGKVNGDWSPIDIFKKFLDIITITIPPSLLAALQCGKLY
jgi:magnesium-transporting ATPase (P-type)